MIEKQKRLTLEIKRITSRISKANKPSVTEFAALLREYKAIVKVSAKNALKTLPTSKEEVVIWKQLEEACEKYKQTLIQIQKILNL